MEIVLTSKEECNTNFLSTVEVTKIIHYDAQNSFAIFLAVSVDSEIKIARKYIGKVPGLSVGEILKVDGYVEHGKYRYMGNDEQIRITSYEEILPENLEGICKYLSSGIFPGIGKRTAQKIVEHFGDETWDVIDNRPAALLDIPGIRQKTLDKMLPVWMENRSRKRIIPFCLSCGFSKATATKIFSTYGDSARSIIMKNPYRLSADIKGIGFKTIDVLALGKLKFATPDSKERMYGAILNALQMDIVSGNVFSYLSWLRPKVEEMLEISIANNKVLEERFLAAIHDLETDNVCILKGVIPESKSLYYKPLYYAEAYLGSNLLRILEHRLPELDITAKAGLYFSIQLSEEQQMAVAAVFRNKITVITGGPGTGKSHLTKFLVDFCTEEHLSFKLLASTGRAAKRLQQATDMSAQTVHRALGFYDQGTSVESMDDSGRIIDSDLLIVDEASMMDVYLARKLFSAVQNKTRVVLIGDVDQLPSIGPGDVLRDLINSGVVAVSRLSKVFRQEHQSRIIQNAIRINHGLYPVCQNNFSGKDSEFVYIETPAKTNSESTIVEIVSDILPNQFGFSPLSDIQVLSSRRNGVSGVNNLNVLLREAINPARKGSREGTINGVSFRQGDKVMQTRNNYSLGVFNGDVGFVTDVNEDYQIVRVNYPDLDSRTVTYSNLDAVDLVSAYAVTVHKSQGSEINVVVFVFHESHLRIIQRNLLYTAITRAKKMVVLVGPKSVLYRAVNDTSVAYRNSNLKEILSRLRLSYRS